MQEAIDALGSSSGTTLNALARLQRRHAIFSPAKGLYVAVPPEYRSWGVVPGEWFIDAMMRHLRRPYYVALLTAARLQGASHQAPQVFQAMVDRDAPSARPRFRTNSPSLLLSSKHIDKDSTELITVPTGYVTVSSKETTVVDLISHSRASGGYGNVATIVKEIGALHGAELARVAARRSRAAARRTGWFVERFGQVDDLEALRQAARVDLGDPSLLDPAGPKRGKSDRDWRVRLNIKIEPDI